MHSSLYKDSAETLEAGRPPSPAPIIDAHMHIGDVKSTRAYVEAAKSYGVRRAVGEVALKAAPAIRDAFADFFSFSGRIRFDGMDKPHKWLSKQMESLEKMAEMRFSCVKYKVVPEGDARPTHWIDDERLDPIHKRTAELGFTLQTHIAQPTCWWGKHFDAQKVGDKMSYFKQLENVLHRYPELPVIGVHMGGYPERLDYLDHLLTTYPNYYLDTSATKWTVRELSRQRDQARDFFLKWQDRIMFGSDLVVHKKVCPTYYTSRFWVQRTMWESAGRRRSLIKDPDAQGEPALHGLDLPEAVLARLYRDNASRLLSRTGCQMQPEALAESSAHASGG